MATLTSERGVSQDPRTGARPLEQQEGGEGLDPFLLFALIMFFVFLGILLLRDPALFG